LLRRKTARMRGRRDFTLLWSASATSQLGSICATTANPLLALWLTHSPVVVGWVVAASTVPPFLMYLPAGWLVDRCNRRALMFIGQIGRLVACALVVVALTFEHKPIGLIILAALCEECFLVLYNAAEITAVQQAVNSESLPSALAMNEARVHIAVMAAKPLSGFLFGLNRIFPYCLNGLASIWSIFALIIMKKKDYQAHDVDRSSGTATSDQSGESTLSVAKAMLLNSFLRTVIVVCTIGNFLFQITLLLLVVLAEQRDMSAAGIGLLLATSGVCGLAGSIIARMIGTRVRDEQNVIKFCVVTWAALTLVVAISAQPMVGLIAWGGLSITGGFLNVAMNTYQVRKIPERILGRVVGINCFFTNGAVSAGALSAGYIVAALQPQAAAWLVSGVSMAMIVVVFILVSPRRLLPDRMVNWLKARLSLRAAPTEEIARIV
jgi:MFS family permease